MPASTRCDAARALLELETELGASRGDPHRLGDWSAFASMVFAESAVDQRRSRRLACDLRCEVRLGPGTFTCRVRDVSLTGMALRGSVLAYVPAGTPAELVSVGEGTAARSVRLPLVVSHVRWEGDMPMAALTPPMENLAQWQRYFDEVYYPSYLLYLARLAEGADTASHAA